MQENSALVRAMDLVRDLRARCPWDRAQTRETLRPYLVEEALELDHALGGGSADAIQNELADVLLNVAFQLVLAEELGQFTADDVALTLERKIQRRHPHPVRLFQYRERLRSRKLRRKICSFPDLSL